jgi:hypothetical protein
MAGAWRTERPLGMGSRMGHGSLIDDPSGRLIVVGGWADWSATPNSPAAMIRSLDAAGGWEYLGAGSPSVPEPSYASAMAIDPAHHALFVFGGQATDGSGRLLGDLWSISLEPGGLWRRLQFAGAAPPARRYGMFFHDAVHGRLILMGGDDLTQPLSDAWELRLEPEPAWRPLTPTTTEPFPYGAVYPDPLRGDAWCFSLNRAVHLVLGDDTIGSDESFEVFPYPDGNAPEAYQFAGFDRAGRRFLVLTAEPWFPPLSMLDRAWWVSLYPGHEWTEAPIQGPMPRRRDFFSTSWDATRQRLIVTGGYDEDQTYFADTWALQMPAMLPTAVVASLRAAQSDERGVRLEWQVSDAAGASAFVQRSGDGVAWTDAGAARWTSVDELLWDGPPLASEAREAFRLVVAPGANETRTAAVWMDGPAAASLALAPLANPSGHELSLRLSLRSGPPARLRVLDAAGRVVAEAAVPAGSRAWNFGRPVAPGLYFAELTQGGERRVAKLVTLR